MNENTIEIKIVDTNPPADARPPGGSSAPAPAESAASPAASPGPSPAELRELKEIAVALSRVAGAKSQGMTPEILLKMPPETLRDMGRQAGIADKSPGIDTPAGRDRARRHRDLSNRDALGQTLEPAEREELADGAEWLKDQAAAQAARKPTRPATPAATPTPATPAATTTPAPPATTTPGLRRREEGDDDLTQAERSRMSDLRAKDRAARAAAGKPGTQQWDGLAGGELKEARDLSRRHDEEVRRKERAHEAEEARTARAAARDRGQRAKVVAGGRRPADAARQSAADAARRRADARAVASRARRATTLDPGGRARQVARDARAAAPPTPAKPAAPAAGGGATGADLLKQLKRIPGVGGLLSKALGPGAGAAAEALGGVGVSGGTVAAVGAVALPLAIAAGAAVAAAAAVDSLTRRGRELAGYDAGLARANADADVRKLRAEIAEAEVSGESIAKLTENQSKIEDGYSAVADVYQTLGAELLAALTEPLALLGEFLGEARPLLKVATEVGKVMVAIQPLVLLARGVAAQIQNMHDNAQAIADLLARVFPSLAADPDKLGDAELNKIMQSIINAGDKLDLSPGAGIVQRREPTLPRSILS